MQLVRRYAVNTLRRKCVSYFSYRSHDVILLNISELDDFEI